MNLNGNFECKMLLFNTYLKYFKFKLEEKMNKDEWKDIIIWAKFNLI